MDAAVPAHRGGGGHPALSRTARAGLMPFAQSVWASLPHCRRSVDQSCCSQVSPQCMCALGLPYLPPPVLSSSLLPLSSLLPPPSSLLLYCRWNEWGSLSGSTHKEWYSLCRQRIQCEDRLAAITQQLSRQCFKVYIQYIVQYHVYTRSTNSLQNMLFGLQYKSSCVMLCIYMYYS